MVSFGTNSRLECQFWILHVQKTKNISIHKLFIFVGRQVFRLSANFLWHSCQTCNQCERKSFPTKRYSLRKLVVCILNFRVWAEDIWIFVGFLAFCLCRGINAGKKPVFLKKKNNFSVVFGVWATKLRFQETIRHVRINCSLRVRRNPSSYTFEYVITCIYIFRSWAKKFLPPMETHWDACQTCVSRDQKNVIGKFCFKWNKPNFLKLNSGSWARDYETIGCVFFAKLSKVQWVCPFKEVVQ